MNSLTTHAQMSWAGPNLIFAHETVKSRAGVACFLGYLQPYLKGLLVACLSVIILIVLILLICISARKYRNTHRIYSFKVQLRWFPSNSKQKFLHWKEMDTPRLQNNLPIVRIYWILIWFVFSQQSIFLFVCFSKHSLRIVIITQNLGLR